MTAAQPEHRRVMSALPADQREALKRRSDGPGLLRFALHGGAVLALGGLIVARVPGWPALLAPQGVALVFLFCVLHEALHGTAFATAWINRTAARLCGCLLLLPSEWFRHFHLAHHRHTQDPARDPELATPKPATWSAYLLHVSGLPVWRGQLGTLWRNARGRCDDAFVPASARPRVAGEARIAVALYVAVLAASAAAASPAALNAWVIPALLGQPFLRLFLLAEHARCPLVPDMLANSRTTLTHRLVRALSWNMSFHVEHHVDPSVPFHRLPSLHALIRDRIRVTEHGYLRFHRGYLASLPPRASGA